MRLNSFIASAVIIAASLLAQTSQIATVASGGLVKGSLPAVYYVGADGKRYVFPNDKVYFSWYADFSAVNTVSDAELANYVIGGNVTYKPGSRLVKIQSDPKVYAVDADGTLRWVNTEAAAVALYGSDWSKKVDDLSDSFFVNYKTGNEISSASDFNPVQAAQIAQSINVDKKLSSASGNVNANANVNAPTPGDPQPTTACTPACGLGNACVANACKAAPGPSAMKVSVYLIDSFDTCFIGDPCTGGACCSVAGTQFADNGNLKTVRPVDKYLYADKQQLCGRATVSSIDRSRINQQLDDFSKSVGATTSYRMSAAVSTVRISGDFTMSRIPETCQWWVSPVDLRDRLAGQLDSTVDSVFVEGARNFDFGAVDVPDSKTLSQAEGLGGAGYTYLVKEWEKDTSGAPDYSLFTSAFTSQMNYSVDLGITKPDAPFIGNHCRDGRRDFDETGVDCGGLGCRACVN